ncbi:hypothetical protein [Streptomyces phage phiScoe3]|nr:hypothetical protein [Streptomyces phage phiScoe3]
MVSGAVMAEKTREPEPTPIHDTQPIPRVTTTVTVTPKPSPSPTKAKPKPKPSPKASLRTPKQIGKALAAKRGWTGSEWEALESLWTGESDWNPHAQNPTSTAYGIAQFLDDTWAYVGATKTSDATRQIEAGLDYIAASYGTPSKALAFWHSNSPHWY